MIVFLSSVYSILASLNLLPFEIWSSRAGAIANFNGLNIFRNLGSSEINPSVYAFFLLFSILIVKHYIPASPFVFLFFVVTLISAALCVAKPMVLMYLLSLFSFPVFKSRVRLSPNFYFSLSFLQTFFSALLFLFMLFRFWPTISFFFTNIALRDAIWSGSARLDKVATAFEPFALDWYQMYIGHGYKHFELITGDGIHSGFFQYFWELGLISFPLIALLSMLWFKMLIRVIPSRLDCSIILVSSFFLLTTSDIFFNRLLIFFPCLIYPLLATEPSSCSMSFVESSSFDK